MGDPKFTPYVPKDYGLRQAAAAPDVYYLRSALPPATYEEVPREYEDDDVGVHVRGSWGGRTVATYRSSYQQNLCEPFRYPNYAPPKPHEPDSHQWHYAKVTCLRSARGTLAEDTKYRKDGSVVARYYSMIVKRGDRVVMVDLGPLPNPATAWWEAGLADADLARWQPSSTELRRLDDLLRATG